MSSLLGTISDWAGSAYDSATNTANDAYQWLVEDTESKPKTVAQQNAAETGNSNGNPTKAATTGVAAGLPTVWIFAGVAGVVVILLMIMLLSRRG